MSSVKIILSSKEKFLLDQGYDLLGIPQEELKIGIIDTALKTSEDQSYLDYVQDYYNSMVAANIDFKILDIDGKSEEEILEFFTDRNVVQVGGGNAFYLLKKIREVGFDLVLKQLLNKGLYYIGCSAGSYIMCPSIEVSSWKLGRNRYGVTDFASLNYVPFVLKCHYKESIRESIIEKSRLLKYPLRILTNDQCLLIENEEVKFVGEGEEVVL
jgi:peptidase E